MLDIIDAELVASLFPNVRETLSLPLTFAIRYPSGDLDLLCISLFQYYPQRAKFPSLSFSAHLRSGEIENVNLFSRFAGLAAGTAGSGLTNWSI